MMEIIQELADRLTDLEENFDRLQRWGKVESVDISARTVTVEYPDGLVSTPMACASLGAWLGVTPDVGDPVVVICPGGYPDAAFAVIGMGVTDSAEPGDFVALAQKVDDMGAALADAIKSHVHVTTATVAATPTAGTISPTTTTVTLSPTAATKVKAE